MKYIIEDTFLIEKNIKIEDEIIQNGEERFRIRTSDFSGVNITRASDNPSWQNAHYHEYCKELYIVQEGEILIATKEKDDVIYKITKKGEVQLINPMVKHNVYMLKNSKTITVKFGDTREKDWVSADDLDETTKDYKVE